MFTLKSDFCSGSAQKGSDMVGYVPNLLAGSAMDPFGSERALSLIIQISHISSENLLNFEDFV